MKIGAPSGIVSISHFACFLVTRRQPSVTARPMLASSRVE
jgi:hypothetical protein